MHIGETCRTYVKFFKYVRRGCDDQIFVVTTIYFRVRKQGNTLAAAEGEGSVPREHVTPM